MSLRLRAHFRRDPRQRPVVGSGSDARIATVHVAEPGADGRIQLLEKSPCVGNPLHCGCRAAGGLIACDRRVYQLAFRRTRLLGRYGVSPVAVVRHRCRTGKFGPCRSCAQTMLLRIGAAVDSTHERSELLPLQGLQAGPVTVEGIPARLNAGTNESMSKACQSLHCNAPADPAVVFETLTRLGALLIGAA